MPTKPHSRTTDQEDDVVVSEERSDPRTVERREVFPGLPGGPGLDPEPLEIGDDVLVGNATELTIDGEPASDVRALGIRTEDAFRPFLGQCEIQALIDSEQQSRWEQLSAILGFAGFGQLRRAAPAPSYRHR